MQVICRPFLCLLTVQLIICSLCAQNVRDAIYSKRTSYFTQNQQLDQPIAPESDCSNGRDDNGNGLVDVEDSHCYFYLDSINYQACEPSDILNDIFQLSSTCGLQGIIEIFNRWGQSIYKSEKLEIGWNGELGGKRQPEGIYVYIIRFSYSDHPETFTRKGAVTLVR